MRNPRKEKYERFRSILIEPYDQDLSGTFPIFTGSRHFDLSDYVNESANHPVEMFDNVIKAIPDGFFWILDVDIEKKHSIIACIWKSIRLVQLI